MGYDDFYARARRNSQAQRQALKESLGRMRLGEIADEVEKKAKSKSFLLSERIPSRPRISQEMLIDAYAWATTEGEINYWEQKATKATIPAGFCAVDIFGKVAA